MFRHRSAWRHRAVLFDGIRSGQEAAVADYLERRFGPDVPFIDGESARVLPPKPLDGSSGSSTNQAKAVVLVGPKNHRKMFRLESWLEDGWVVDYTATLAVRLLARSARVRRNSVALVPCETGTVDQPFCDRTPSQSAPGWWENLCRIILRCHYLATNWYWFSRSAVGKSFFSGIRD